MFIISHGMVYRISYCILYTKCNLLSTDKDKNKGDQGVRPPLCTFTGVQMLPYVYKINRNALILIERVTKNIFDRIRSLARGINRLLHSFVRIRNGRLSCGSHLLRVLKRSSYRAL